MEICMKDTLRTLRQKKNVTQEALAGHLGITPQSVGKWERGEGFPDITLLPAIALYFDVTVDELLGVGKTRIEERIAFYEAESLRLRNIGSTAENEALWEQAYREFPNDCRVLCGLMRAINREGEYPCPPEKAERKIALGKRILAECTDTEIREKAVQELCYTYESIGDTENALHYAGMGGSMFITREDLRCSVLTGEEGAEACQKYLRNLILLADMTATSIPYKTDAAPEEHITALRFGIDLFRLLYSDDNVGFDAHHISRNWAEMAHCYAKLQDAENTLAALTEAARYAAMTANLGEVRYTAPMVSRTVHKPENSTKNYKGNACNLRLKELQRPVYDSLRNDSRFQQILHLLETHAE